MRDMQANKLIKVTQFNIRQSFKVCLNVTQVNIRRNRSKSRVV